MCRQLISDRLSGHSAAPFQRLPLPPLLLLKPAHFSCNFAPPTWLILYMNRSLYLSASPAPTARLSSDSNAKFHFTVRSFLSVSLALALFCSQWDVSLLAAPPPSNNKKQN